MDELILLGAGASVEAKVPAAYEMTRAILQKFDEKPSSRQYAQVAKFVVGGLLFQQGIRGDNPLDSRVNVEDVFNAVQLLAERNTIEAAPFIGAWHAMIEELDQINEPILGLDRLMREIYNDVRKQLQEAFSQNPPSSEAKKIDKTLERAINKTVAAAIKDRSVSFNSSESLGQAVDNYISQIVGRWTQRLASHSPGSNVKFEKEFQHAVEATQAHPGEGRVFQETAEQMIRTLSNIVWIDSTDQIAYLEPLIEAAKQRQRTVVATLNYDNAIELAALVSGLKCDTGIDEWSRTGVFNTTGNGLHLLKLHGSIDWESTQERSAPDRLFPQTAIGQVPPEKLRERGFRPAVIFGQKNKLTTEGPFLDLLRAFQQELTQVSTLTVVGYSFGDEHVNTYISTWLNAGSHHRIRIVDPHINRRQDGYVANLKQLRHTSPDRVEFVSKKASEGLAQLYGSQIPKSAEVSLQAN